MPEHSKAFFYEEYSTKIGGMYFCSNVNEAVALSALTKFQVELRDGRVSQCPGPNPDILFWEQQISMGLTFSPRLMPFHHHL